LKYAARNVIPYRWKKPKIKNFIAEAAEKYFILLPQNAVQPTLKDTNFKQENSNF
jgi:hypothetical protein